jgi:DNA invertase Pin-like site-specific DNA recombinase
MFLTFPGMIAQQESESISGNMRWSYKKRMESGEFNCCTPAYGFNLIDGELIINEDEAKIVRRIFDMYLKGRDTELTQTGSRRVTYERIV